MINKATAVLLALLSCSLLAGFIEIPEASTSERFTENGDGTVTDHKLGLMWAQTDNQGDIDWQDAERYCRMGPPNLLGKYDNWRMPTLEELRSLYVEDSTYSGYETTCGQNVRIVPEIQLSCGWIWCHEKKAISAQVFTFSRGYQYTDRISSTRNYRALPVRSLQDNEQ
ncbi:MAG: DUF1566 domain-containing protein [Desulfoferrobacter sp.]